MTTGSSLSGEAIDATDELIRLGDGGAVPAGAGIVAHRRFEELARRHADQTAVVYYDETLTYGELDRRANAMCRRLRAAGVGRERVVGICLPRRLDVLIAVLAVMKSGGAYLPLDLVQPLERRRFMLKDAEAAALVTVPGWEEELNESSLPVVHPDGDAKEDTGEAEPDPADPALGDLAYVIYTSGSTGQPKGVMIEHRSLAAYVDWGVTYFSRDELRSVLMATSFGFDMSVFEFMFPLSAGGKIVLVDSLFEIREVEHHGLTLVNAVPSLMAALLGSGVTLPRSVRTAVFCGETLPFEVSEAVHAQPGIERLVNTYGPTEDTVYSTCVEVPRGVRPTIGRPFAGTQAYVVDEDLNLVPRGEEGELCLGGVGLARGYKGRDELTGARFVASPFPGSERLYRTGDLARWEPDGSLQHLGRIDHQIKLHGVRIEPADIEEAILRHPDIRQTVVVAREKRGGGKWLVGYIVCESGRQPDGRELREMLRTSLPKPMIPSVFVTLDALPLNANGKLDRAELPEPLSSATGARPLTPSEQKVGEMWRELLSLEGLPSPEDDYFELGGDSLRAFELFDRVEAAFGRLLSPNVLLEASTLGSLAELIDSGRDSSRLVKLHADGTRIPTIYVQSGAGGMLALRKFGAVLGPDQPLYGIQALIDQEIEAGGIGGVPEIAAQCMAALREAQPQGPYILVGHSIGGHVAYEMAAQLEASGEKVLLLGLLDPAGPHTLRWRGRTIARALELTGLGAEPRREGAHRVAWSAVKRQVGWRLHPGRNGDGAEGGGSPDRPSLWMRNLRAIEQSYQPPRYGGRVVAYTTAENTRYTGSTTLGWDRYVDGPLTTRRVPGDHVSMLLEPNVDVVAAAMDADIRDAQSGQDMAGLGAQRHY
jgi:amino acid adenylation domain-containing protein